jgi:hypothetical protein
MIRVEMQLPPVVHDVALKAIERWVNAPAINPSKQGVKRAFRAR